MSLIAEVAAATTPQATSVLDVGCGAGNYTLALLERLPNLDVTLIDLSRPMLDRAVERIQAATSGKIEAIQGDIRDIDIGFQRHDIIVAASVLHHLRDDSQWRAVYTTFFAGLRAGGSVWIFDLIDSSIPEVQATMRRRYGEYLTQLKDEAYRDQVFAYVEKEDTPRSLMFQLDLLREVGFSQVEVLHKNACFAAFGAVKTGERIRK
jgi:tRNA (cmo5U34)-methyltransferase